MGEITPDQVSIYWDEKHSTYSFYSIKPYCKCVRPWSHFQDWKFKELVTATFMTVTLRLDQIQWSKFGGRIIMLMLNFALSLLVGMEDTCLDSCQQIHLDSGITSSGVRNTGSCSLHLITVKPVYSAPPPSPLGPTKWSHSKQVVFLFF